MHKRNGKLSVRQETFAEHFVRCGNAAEAARLAGYSARSAKVQACRLTNDNRVVAEIAKRRKDYQQELQITKDDVVAGLLSAIQLAKEQQNPSAMISGLAQIAKLCGFYEPDVSRIEIPDESLRLKHRFADMSDDELLAVIASH